jgi:metallo-beta-lactamase class B
MNLQSICSVLSRFTLICLFLFTQGLHATPESWSTPFPGHKVIGNLYYVGTEDLGVFLITSDEGHILINTGLADSTALIRDSVESLGFDLKDIKILLTMQAHWDHAAALAEIKKISGAAMWATKDDTRLLEDGGFSDPLFGGKETFKPVKVDKIIGDGEVIELGDTRLQVYEHPGHTEGSSSYSMQVRENGRDYKVAIANMATIAGKTLANKPTYAGIANDFAETFRKQKNMAVDIWVAAHASQYGLHDKYQPGQLYSPDTFVDPKGFLIKVEALEAVYLKQLAEEQSKK